jgi:hypothetical protein
MAKLLHTNLLLEGAAVHSAPVGSAPKASAKTKGPKSKTLSYIIFGAVILIGGTIVGYLYLAEYFGNKMSQYEDIVQHPLRMPDGMKPGGGGDPSPMPTDPDEQLPSPTTKRSGGLVQIPWIGAYEKLISSLAKADFEIFSITSGAEGRIYISGRTSGEITESIIPGITFAGIDMLDSRVSEGGTTFLADAKLAPIEEISFDPAPVPPYERGEVIRKLDTMAKSAGLKGVSTQAVGHEKIAEGSRYSISVTGAGTIGNIVAFTESAMEMKSMMEIGKITIESVSDKSIKEGEVRFGLVYRVYDLPPIKTPAVEQPLAVEL